MSDEFELSHDNSDLGIPQHIYEDNNEEPEEGFILSVGGDEAYNGLPTQVVHPWRSVVRTVIQNVSGTIVAGLVWVLASVGIDISELSAELIVSVSVLLSLFFSGLVTKIMAREGTEEFLIKWFPSLATGVHNEK